MKILVVDDTPGVADILAQMLNINGHQAQMASTLEDASRELEASQYDACMVDLDIEDAQGRMLSLIRSQGARAIAWTASEDVWRGSATAERFDAFLAKPSSFAMILAALEGVPCLSCLRPFNASSHHAHCMWDRTSQRE